MPIGTSKIVTKTALSTAQEFYDHLIRRQTSNADENGRLLYRRHASASYKMVPSAIREGAAIKRQSSS
ncbi:hypothetical protein SAMN04515695_1479 [Pseudovibrio sp. Tun.PSC04-5.I4]|nr:hypothetical protein SAMN04515695_1479 [Pseudovibrio sp. Tun.PSC04-5.I4]